MSAPTTWQLEVELGEDVCGTPTVPAPLLPNSQVLAGVNYDSSMSASEDSYNI